jgi:NTP pyrophosphatase (non-canonical NTP hydrolase)
MDLAELQAAVWSWTMSTFGTEASSHLSLLKAMEELGELSGAYLARTEHRKDTSQVDVREKVIDGVADTIIALTVFCVREDIDLQQVLESTLRELLEREYERLGRESSRDDYGR